MPDLDEEQGKTKEASSTGLQEEKEAIVAAREKELELIAPVLRSMRWSKIKIGRTVLRDIEKFINYYKMYAPLLAEHKDKLLQARDSREHHSFELHASTTAVKVHGIDRAGNRTEIVVVREQYWQGKFEPRSPIITPL